MARGRNNDCLHLKISVNSIWGSLRSERIMTVHIYEGGTEETNQLQDR